MKIINVLCVFSAMMLNAQSVLEALEPVPYIHEEQRVRTITYSASNCEAPGLYYPADETVETKINYKSFSWVSAEHAKKKIDEHFGSSENTITGTDKKRCGNLSILTTLTQRYYAAMEVYTPTDQPCPKREFFELSGIPQPADFISQKYDYGVPKSRYDELRRQNNRRDTRSEYYCTMRGKYYWVYSYIDTSYDYTPGYIDKPYTNQTISITLK